MRKKKILVCDDDDGILMMMETLLNRFNYETRTELDSRNVFESIKAFDPDLMIIDLWMPHISGDEIIKKIRSAEKENELPVIVISASWDGKQIAIEAGADGFLAKPFNIEELIKTVEKALKKADRNVRLNAEDLM